MHNLFYIKIDPATIDSDITVETMDDAMHRFTVDASGSSPLSYTWYINNTIQDSGIRTCDTVPCTITYTTSMNFAQGQTEVKVQVTNHDASTTFSDNSTLVMYIHAGKPWSSGMAKSRKIIYYFSIVDPSQTTDVNKANTIVIIVLPVLLATAAVVIIVLLLILACICAKKQSKSANNSKSVPMSVTIDIGEVPIVVSSENSANVTQLIKTMDKVLSDVLYKIEIDEVTRTSLENLRNAMVMVRRSPSSRVQTDGVHPKHKTEAIEYQLGTQPGAEDPVVYDNLAYATCTPLLSEHAAWAQLLPNTAIFLKSQREDNSHI